MPGPGIMIKWLGAIEIFEPIYGLLLWFSPKLQHHPYIPKLAPDVSEILEVRDDVEERAVFGGGERITDLHQFSCVAGIALQFLQDRQDQLNVCCGAFQSGVGIAVDVAIAIEHGRRMWWCC